LLKASCLAALLLAGCGTKDNQASSGGFNSGPQVGETVPGAFEPLNVTGDNAGKKFCQYCKNGPSPVAVIFARETSPELASLIKKIDLCTAKNEKAQTGSFVVFLNDAEPLADELKELAKNEKIEHCVLTIDNPAGPGA